MIYGKVRDGRVIVPVVFRLASQPDFFLDFIIDTGFNDHLTLPPQAVSTMNLPLYSSTEARLADGSKALLSIHLATIVWDGIERLVPVLAAGYEPLLGTSLMAGYHLEIDFQDNGLVSLEQL
ncbi:clan AA aspartic protease [Nostoc parmelioides]|uniref:Clan AA aspartic protease n=1 Tax=Nostoc parmelioides FACHB-3921 TaxID=2692909 RepID=A0ABR8BA41_9NOSO|nr:clan AA aspartic protease [Nostoc parmelioides]MBD2250599.1 clan AA aspartic protease [Nostoc parmelioides FACHB-3921]